MTEEMQPQAGTTPQPQAGAVEPIEAPAQPQAGDAQAEIMTLKEARELRRESQKLHAKLAEMERRDAEAAEKAAQEQGKWQELYERTKPQAERVKALETFLGALLEQELASVPEKQRDLVPEFDDPLKKLEWVRKAKAGGLLMAPAAPSTDASTGTGNTGIARAASDQAYQLQVAERLGLTHAVKAFKQGS